MAHNNLSASEDAPARPIAHDRSLASSPSERSPYGVNLGIGVGVRLALSGNRVEEPLG
jgi:hypothetical protein